MIRMQEREQRLLVNSIIELGGLTEEALCMLRSGIEQEDNISMKKLQEYSSEIRSRARECERDAIKIILLHHPVARDLRLITSAIRMSNDLERIGDNAGDIGEVIPFIKNKNILKEASILEMCDLVDDMLKDALDALVESSLDKARMVAASDDAVDDAFLKAKNCAIEMIRQAETDADEAPDVLMVAKYLERMGDHAASFASYVGWNVSGDDNWLIKSSMV